MIPTRKKRASAPEYRSPDQLVLPGFESPFSRNLAPCNRWVVLAGKIPWDALSNIYLKSFPQKSTGRPALSPRVVIGSIIIKHICNLDDRETVAQISENMYMQYFLGYSSFSNEVPFDASLFVEFRKRLGKDELGRINELIVRLNTEKLQQDVQDKGSGNDNREGPPTHGGSMIVDATACPQDITYPTDLGILNDCREKSEELMDIAFAHSTITGKPRNYRQRVRRDYLVTAQKKNKSRKEIRKALGKQLRYIKRNLITIGYLLDHCEGIPFDRYQYRYWLVIQHAYAQQLQMYEAGVHSIDDRIVSIHQPHVRPIVRGKSTAKVEFGAKINVSLASGFAFIDDLEWNAYNEGTRLPSSVERYRERFGYYPEKVLADKIYCNRENRRYLKERGITLVAKPLGRPSAQASQNRVSPGERNPIEGKFGQGKTGYGLNRIMARLSATSESWIASIILVLNLVKLTEIARLWMQLILIWLINNQKNKDCLTF